MTRVAKVPSSGYTRGSASGSHFLSPRLQLGLGVIIGTRMFEDLRMAHHTGRYGVVEETTVLGHRNTWMQLEPEGGRMAGMTWGPAGLE